MQQQAQAGLGVTQGTQRQAQATAQATQAQQASTQSTNQLAAAYIAMAQAIQQQTQGYTQAQAAALKFRQEQAILSAETRKAAQEARAAGEIWRQIFAVAGGIGLATSIAGIIVMLKNLAVESVNVAVKMQSLQATFRFLSGSIEAGNATLGFLRETANRVGIDFLSLAKNFGSFSAATRGTALEGQKAKEIFVAFAEASRVLGLSTHQTTSIFLALEQMISKGKVSREELQRQLGNALPGAMQIAARSVGLTSAAFQEMLTAGVESAGFLEKFATQVKREFGQGIAEAVQTAAASFARFANNMRDISVAVGNSLLILLKPFLDFINVAFDKVKEIEARASAAANQNVGAIPGARGAAVPGPLEGQLNKAQDDLLTAQQDLRRLQLSTPRFPGSTLEGAVEGEAAIKEATRSVNEARGAYDALMKKREEFINQLQEGRGAGKPPGALVPFEEASKEITKSLEEMGKDLLAIQAESQNFMSTDTLETAKATLQAIDKTIKGISETIAKSPGLMKYLPQDIGKQVADLNDFRVATQAIIDIQKQQRDAPKEDEQALKKDLAAVIEIRKAQAAATEQEIADQEHAFDVISKLEQKLLKEQKNFTEEVTALGAKGTKTQLDDFIAATNKKREALLILARSEEDIRQVNAAADGAILEKQTEVVQKEADKQARVWQQLANSIQSTLSNAFLQVLQGSKTIFEGIKDLFFKLIANMAAYALTHAVIIPVLTQLLGGNAGGATAGGRTASVVGSVFSAAGFDIGGVTGGGSGGPNTVGLAQSGITAASGTSGALGGPTTASLLGGLFKGTGASTYLSGLAATPLYTVGATSSLAPAASIEGTTGLAGSFGTGTTVTVGSAASGIISGVGIGIAAGMILKEINDAIGIRGKAGGALAGAGGGAAGGAIIGTAIAPGIGTAIGAIAGTLVGAIGGWLFSRKPPRPPEFGFFNAPSQQAGQVGLEPFTNKLIETQSFNLAFGPGRNLGGIKPHLIAESLTKAVEQVFQNAIGVGSGFAPQIQKALVAPLNAASQQVVDALRNRKFKGSDIQEQLDTFTQKELPDLLQNTLGKLIEAAKKIDPLVKEFGDFILSTQSVIDKLKQTQAQYAQSIDAQIKSITQATFTPAQLFEAGKQDLAALQAQFAAASPAGKLALVPQIQALIASLLDLGKRPEVLGQEPLAVQMLQTELIGVLNEIKTGTNTVFTDLQGALTEQIALANAQIDLLTASLGNLGSIDTAAQNAAAALEAMRATVTILQDPSLTQAQFSVAVLAQGGILQNIAGIGLEQLSELRRIAGGGGGIASPGGPVSDVGGTNEGGFALGSAYIPYPMRAWLHTGERVLTAAQVRQEQGSIIYLNVNGAGDPGRVADEVIRRIEKQSSFGTTTIQTRR